MCTRCANMVRWTPALTPGAAATAAAAAAGVSRCSCESTTALSIFSKALWWLHILSLCLQPRLFWWQRLSRHRLKSSCSLAPCGEHGSYFNIGFVTKYWGHELSHQTFNSLGRWIQMYIGDIWTEKVPPEYSIPYTNKRWRRRWRAGSH